MSFSHGADPEPLRYSKKSWNGFFLRLQKLAAAGIHIPPFLDAAGQRSRDPGRVSPDDILDAAAAAWSATVGPGEKPLRSRIPRQSDPTVAA